MKAQQITEHEGIRFNYMQESGLIMIRTVMMMMMMMIYIMLKYI